MTQDMRHIIYNLIVAAVGPGNQILICITLRSPRTFHYQLLSLRSRRRSRAAGLQRMTNLNYTERFVLGQKLSKSSSFYFCKKQFCKHLTHAVTPFDRARSARGRLAKVHASRVAITFGPLGGHLYC